MQPNWVFVLPGKAKLEIMSGNSFVNNDRPRILCSGAPEVTKVPGRLAHVANAILIQSRRRSEVVVFAKTKNAQIFRHRPQSVMLQPTGHGENAVLVEEVANLQFLGRGIFYPGISIFRELKWRDIFVAFFLIAFKCDRPVPFLLSHCQNLFRRKRVEGDVFEKEKVGVTPERCFFWRRWQSLLQICSKMFQRIGRAISCPIQFLLAERGYVTYLRRHFLLSFL